jgi:hypothetical protein
MGSPAEFTFEAWENKIGTAEGGAFYMGSPYASSCPSWNGIDLRFDYAWGYSSLRSDWQQGCGIGGDILVANGTNLGNTGWHNIVYTISPSASYEAIYQDGVVMGTDNSSIAITYGSADTYLGTDFFYTYPGVSTIMNGKFDEVRFLKIALTPSWILTEYNNESSPSTFYFVGNETASPK